MIKKFFINATICLIILLSNSLAFSQDIKGSIWLYSELEDKILVSFKIENDRLMGKNISFLKDYADAENLGGRISDLSLSNSENKSIPYKKFAEGEYLADDKFDKMIYTIDIKSLDNISANAHISWVGKDHGLLMLNDLLPSFKGENLTANINFQLPENWKIKTDSQSVIRKIQKKIAINQTFSGENFEINNFKDAVFLIGKDWREKEIFVNDTRLNFLILDEWQFEDKLAFEMAEEITREYADLFGGIPVKNAQIVLMNFPGEMDRGRWRAETRGANVTILSSQALAESFAKQRLHEQLRHEIFHLWIPNSLNLSGDYAWFYEGFAIYQALKTGVNLEQIRFEDFLNTLEQAYFLNQKRIGENSLIDISKMRWNGEVSSVYAKGMLVAFLCDVAILDKSKGKKDVKDVFREIYQKHSKNSERRDANESILNALQSRGELTPIIKSYIKGAEKIDWAKYIAAFGIENVGSDSNVNLELKSKLSGRQKALLKKLGYNRRRNFSRQKVNKN